MRYEYQGKAPTVDETAFIAPSCDLIGDVSVGAHSSIWYGAVLRGDNRPIKIGDGTSIQDNVSIHGGTVGNRCTVGHNAIIHGCTIGDGVLIGMGSVVLDGATVGDGAVIAAGAVVAPRTVVAPGALMMGVPAQEVRRVDEEEIKKRVATGGQNYIDLVPKYLSGIRPLE